MSWQWRMIQKLKRDWLVVLKLTWGISRILTRALKSLKNSVLMGSLWPKYLMFQLKKYGGVIFHNTDEWCKIWRKTDLWFEKWYEKFGKFSLEHLKVSKLWLWWDPFVQRRKCMSLILQSSYVSWQWRIMQNLKSNWLVVLKLTWEIWRFLTWAIESLKKLCFNGLLVTKVYNFWAKKVQKSYLWWNRRVM